MANSRSRALGSTLVAFIFALTAAALTVATLFIGIRPGGLYLFKVDLERFHVPSRLSSSHLLKDIESVSGGDLTGSDITAHTLGLAQRYTVHVLTHCSHFGKGDKDDSCTRPEVGRWFPPMRTLRLERAGLADGLSDKFRDAVKQYEDAAYFMGVGYIIAFVAIALALVLGLFSQRRRGLGILVAVLASIGSALLLADAVVALRTIRNVVKVMEDDLGHVGISVSEGFLIYLPFIAASLGLIAAMMYSYLAHRTRPSASSTRTHPQRQRSFIIGRQLLSSEPPKPFGKGQTILERVSTWGRGTYVQVEKQKPAPEFRGVPDTEERRFLDPSDEIRHGQGVVEAGQPSPGLRKSVDNLDYRNPHDQNSNDIAMQSLGGRDGRSGAAYEPYSSMLS